MKFSVKWGDYMLPDSASAINRFAGSVKEIFGSNYNRMIIYGSYARGDFHEKSDIDIMILVDIPEDYIWRYESTVYDLAYDIMMDTGIDISPVIKNIDQFSYWSDTLPYYRNINKEGVVFSA